MYCQNVGYGAHLASRIRDTFLCQEGEKIYVHCLTDERIYRRGHSNLALRGVSKTSCGDQLEVSSAAEIRCLFDKLVDRNVVNFQLAVVRLCTQSASEVRLSPQAEAVENYVDPKAEAKLTIHNLYMKAGHTGL
eukprot:2768921-Amphidinium_carterae.1